MVKYQEEKLSTMGNMTKKEKELASKYNFNLHDYVDPTSTQRTEIKKKLKDPKVKDFKNKVDTIVGKLYSNSVNNKYPRKAKYPK